MPFSRDNHFIPKVYLRNFALANGRIYRYRLLVSRESVSPWKTSHVTATGYQRNLYTRIVGGQESDDFEHWLSEEFEAPAAGALLRAVNEDRLARDDYRVLSRFVAAQIVRTPAFLTKNMGRWVAEAQQEMHEAPARIARKLEELQRTGTHPEQSISPAADYFPIRVREIYSADPRKRAFTTEMTVGRAYWLFAMRHMLTSTLARLAEHRWTILKAPEGLPWFTSDDPVVKLNFHSPQKYDFGGGWGSEGTELLMPISPQHLLYTQIGRKNLERGTIVSPEQALGLRTIIAQHAHRVIYSQSEDHSIETLRPRWVDQSAVLQEQEQWRKWHSEQSLAEKFLESSNRAS